MKTLTISTNNVMENAIMFATKNHSDMITSIGKGAQMEALKKRMMRGEVCRFAYKKVNGEIRVAVGSLQENAVKANLEGTGVPKRFYGMFAYLDLEKMAWRGFKFENFIGIIED